MAKEDRQRVARNAAALDRMQLQAQGRKCPHCGNTDPRTIETNGLNYRHPDLTLLCTRRVKPEDSSYSEIDLIPERDYDTNGLVICGMQWEPNNPYSD
jgi:hypothetical protein